MKTWTWRELAERPYLWHCYDFGVALLRVDRWQWRRWWKALTILAELPLVLLAVALFPITVMVAARLRKNDAIQIVADWEKKREQVTK